MRSQWISRGDGRPLVLVTGWAMDYRIFLDIPTDRPVMIIDTYDPFLFPEFLAQLFQKEGILEADLMGFSMGGYAVLQFVRHYPQYDHQMILIGLRPRYPVSELRFFLKKLELGKIVPLLQGFYQSAVAESDYQSFANRVLPDYLTTFSGDDLTRGIRYLADFGHLDDIQSLPLSCLTFVHGRHDKIAPFSELELYFQMSGLSPLLVCLEDAGHCLSDAIYVSNILRLCNRS